MPTLRYGARVTTYKHFKKYQEQKTVKLSHKKGSDIYRQSIRKDTQEIVTLIKYSNDVEAVKKFIKSNSNKFLKNKRDTITASTQLFSGKITDPYRFKLSGDSSATGKVRMYSIHKRKRIKVKGKWKVVKVPKKDQKVQLHNNRIEFLDKVIVLGLEGMTLTGEARKREKEIKKSEMRQSQLKKLIAQEKKFQVLPEKKKRKKKVGKK